MTVRIDGISDSLLVSRIKEDNKDAFKSLYDRYSRKIYSFSYRFLRNRNETEELVQNVFINIWLQRRTLDETLPVKSYIYKSAANYITNYLKKRAIRLKFIELEKQKSEITSDQVNEEVFLHDLETSLNSVVSTLPAQQQKIFRLSRFEGLSYKEIAVSLGLSVRTVENQMYRVLKILRSLLKYY